MEKNSPQPGGYKQQLPWRWTSNNSILNDHLSCTKLSKKLPQKFEASAIMFFEGKKKCRQVSRVFIIYMSFCFRLHVELQLGKMFRWHFKWRKGFLCALWRKTREKRLRILIPKIFVLFRRKTQEVKWMEEKGKLSYCSVIPSMWKYHSIMLWMFHVLIMLFSKERGKQQPESECGWKKMEAKKFLQHTEKCYLFLWQNENVSQSTRYTTLRLSFGLWFASSRYHSISVFLVTRRWKGIKALSIVAVHDSYDDIFSYQCHNQVRLFFSSRNAGKSLGCHEDDTRLWLKTLEEWKRNSN